VLSLVVMLIGIVSYTRLPVREYPKIDEPVVTVDTTYRGASAEIIESQVTKPLEDSLAGIEGVDVLSSISRAENSQITVRFKLERNPDNAAADVRDRVSRVRNRLPLDVEEPVIAKVEADANPIIWLAFSSDSHSPLEVTDVASRIVKPRLQTLPGAADVRVFGERKYSMRVWLDRDRLAAYGLTPQDVEDALRRQNVEVPAGRIESREREFNVVAQTDLIKPEQFGAIVVRSVAGYPVRIKDLGRVEVAAANERSTVRFKGKSAVALGVIKQATANPLELSKAVRAELPRLIADLPQGMTVNIAYDSSVFIDRSIDAVFKTIGEATLLVLHDGDRVLLETRPPAGIWGGLLSLPELPQGADARDWVAQHFSCRVIAVSPAPSFVHVFSHFRLNIAPLLLQVKPGPAAMEPGRQWLDLAATAGAALPAPVRRILDAMKSL
jgi:multidrug efflux pump